MGRKALLIGFNYSRTDCPLKGCHNDVQNMFEFLKSKGYSDTDMVAITDVQRVLGKDDLMNIIIDFMQTEVKDGDHVFFHFSGHGGQLIDQNGDERDGMDECIYADDLQPIKDDDLRKALVDSLPKGASLVTLLDCCHSGTGLDLPFSYTKYGVKKENHASSSKKALCISACEDYDTAADTSYVNSSGKRIPQGALTHAFIDTMTNHHFVGRKWIEVIHRIIGGTMGYHQMAQLSSTSEDVRNLEVEL